MLQQFALLLGSEDLEELVLYSHVLQLHGVLHPIRCEICTIERSFVREISELHSPNCTLSISQVQHQLQSSFSSPWRYVSACSRLVKIHVSFC